MVELGFQRRLLTVVITNVKSEFQLTAVSKNIIIENVNFLGLLLHHNRLKKLTF